MDGLDFRFFFVTQIIPMSSRGLAVNQPFKRDGLQLLTGSGVFRKISNLSNTRVIRMFTAYDLSQNSSSGIYKHFSLFLLK